MPLNKKELFEEIRAMWPDSIRVSTKNVNQSEGSRLQILNDLYLEKERNLDVSDHWHQLGIWAFHQAINRSPDQDGFIHPSNVTFEEFDHCMRKNLEDKSWVVEKAEYSQSF